MSEGSIRKGYKELPPETRQWIEQSEKAYAEDLAKLLAKRQIRQVLTSLGLSPGASKSVLDTLQEELYDEEGSEA